MKKDNKISKKELLKILSEFKIYATCLMETTYNDVMPNLTRFVNYIDKNLVISDFLENKRIESNIVIMSFKSLDLSYLLNEHPNHEITFTHQFLQYAVEKTFGKYKDYLSLASKAGCEDGCTFNDTLYLFNLRRIKPFILHIELYLNNLIIDWGDDENLKSIIYLYGDNFGDNFGANMNNPINNNQSHSSIGVGFNNANIYTEKLAGTLNEAQKQNLAEAAAEIRQLLEELSQTYPTSTTKQKMEVAAIAIDRIENDPIWKQRAINAVTHGGLAAFEKAIDNPIGAFVVGGIKGWQETEIQ